MVEQGSRLELDADDAVDLLRLGDGVIAGHTQHALIGRTESFQHLQRRRLAGAVGTEDTEDLAWPDAQVEPVDGDSLTVAFDDVGSGDDRLCVLGGGIWAGADDSCGHGSNGSLLAARSARATLRAADYSCRVRLV